MTELERPLGVDSIPIAARCFRGCGRAADIRVVDENFCARCYREDVQYADRESREIAREQKRARRG